MTTLTLKAFDPIAYGESMVKFRTSCVSAETMVDNASAIIGRDTLSALLSGEFTPANVALAAYKAFKPMSKAGKECEPKLQGDMVQSVSSLRNAKGGDNARKILDALFDIAALANGKADSEGADVVMPAIQAFIDDANGAAKSVRGLQAVCREAMKAETARIVPNDNDDEQSDEQGNPASGQFDTLTDEQSDAPLTLTEYVQATHAMWEQSSADERKAASEAIALLFDAITNEGEGDTAQAA